MIRQMTNKFLALLMLSALCVNQAAAMKRRPAMCIEQRRRKKTKILDRLSKVGVELKVLRKRDKEKEIDFDSYISAFKKKRKKIVRMGRRNCIARIKRRKVKQLPGVIAKMLDGLLSSYKKGECCEHLRKAKKLNKKTLEIWNQINDIVNG